MPIVDSLVLTPLDEEWRSVMPVLGPDDSAVYTKPVGSITYSLWTVPFEGPAGQGDYLVSGASMGRRTPGQAYAAVFSKQAVDTWKPARVVLLGIAGSLESQRLRLGDVVVAEQIFGYEVEDAVGRGYKFRPTVYQTDALGLDRVRAFFNHKPTYQKWQALCLQAAPTHGLKNVRRPPELHIESVGSGNKVVKSVTFARKLRKEVAAAITAVEMEGHGLHRALCLEADRRDSLMIRGVSDYADGNKTKLERKSKDRWRAYCAANAARLLSSLWIEGTLPSRSTPYTLDLTMGSPLRWRQPQVPDDRIKHAGAHDLVFTTLLNRSAATPELRLTVAAIRRDGTDAGSDFIATLVIESPARQVLHSTPLRDGGRLFTIAASEWGLRAEALLSFPSAAASVEVRCSDDFGRSAVAMLNMPKRR